MHARAFLPSTFLALTLSVWPPMMQQQHPSPSCLKSSQAAGKRTPPRLWGAATHAPAKGRPGGRAEEAGPGGRTMPVVQAGHVCARSLPPPGSLLLCQPTQPFGKTPLLHGRKQLRTRQIYKRRWLSPLGPAAAARRTAVFTLELARK